MNIKKYLVTAASVIAISAASSASAGPRYDFAMKLSGQNQINYASATIKNYQRTMPLFENLVSRYGHYPWAASFKARLDQMKEEVALLQSILDAQTEVVTEVGKETVWGKEFDMVQKGQEQLIDTQIKKVEEIHDSIVKVFEETIRTYERQDTVRRYRGRVIYTIYSNGERVPHVTPLLISTNTVSEQREEVDREFLREYAVVPPEQPESEFGVATANVLTVEEYSARDDVMLGGSQTYIDAVHNVNDGVNVDYITRESGLFKYGESLGYVNAPEAWAKGWTGKGTTIAILDTGIDLDHSEFAGRIKGAECFTATCDSGYETVDDKSRDSHGTHVAGIAAAALDGVGTTGVAPDADILVGKIAWDNQYYEFPAAPEAIRWSVNNGADVINMSGGVNFGWNYGIKSNGDGTFYSDTTIESYKKYGYNGMMNDSSYKGMVEAMSGHDAILVKASGNQGKDVADVTSQYAVQTDEDGNLMFDGRMIIVGSYDVRKGKVSRWSNKAGTMCYEKDSGSTCDNGYRISDYYILAPGVRIAAPDQNGEYRINSGTSMAAPMVSGGVALLRQMWPHMKGENVVKLLMNTADKSIANYDPNVHGQGLMDLDEATNPQGVIGIPTTGRVDGAVASIGSVQQMRISGAQISALEEMMIVDEYDRDFYVNGNDMNVSGLSLNSYSDVAELSIPFDNVKIDLGENANGVSMSYDGLSLGLVNENYTFLGNHADNQLIDVDGSNTVYVGYETSYNVGDTEFFGGASVGLTSLNVNSDAMMKSADDLVSNSARVGVNHKVGNSVIRLSAEMPVAVVDGDARFQVASGVQTNGDIQHVTMESSLANVSREMRYGIGHDFNISENAMIGSYVNYVDNSGSIQGNSTSEIGVNFKVVF